MNWVSWLIPLIAVAVWILSNMARNREEQRRPPRSLPPPPTDESSRGDAHSGPRPRRSAVEIEQFLQDVRRRRDAGDSRKGKRSAPGATPPEPKREIQPLGGRTVSARPALPPGPACRAA